MYAISKQQLGMGQLKYFIQTLIPQCSVICNTQDPSLNHIGIAIVSCDRNHNAMPY